MFNQLNDCPIQNMSLQQQKFKVKIKLWRGGLTGPPPWIRHCTLYIQKHITLKCWSHLSAYCPIEYLKIVYPYILANAFKAPQNIEGSGDFKQCIDCNMLYNILTF